jgi:hypothetical protein
VALAIQRMFGKRFENPARGSKRDLASLAIEQPLPHLALQRLNLRRNRRLRNPQFLRSP